MKKNMVRILAFVLVVILALGIIPLGALAEEIEFWQFYTDATAPKYIATDPDVQNGTYFDNSTISVGAAGTTIKTSSYASNIIVGDKLYDIDQLYLQSYNPTTGTFSAVGVGNSLSIAGVPADASAKENWENKYAYIDLGYTTHQHRLSYWYSDNTTHWRECLTCKKYAAQGFWDPFMFQNWHSDGDDDRVCDVCGHDIPYHEISVEEVKGGKITVELNEAPHRKKIVATAEPAEGYKLKKIHFIKVRDDGSEQEITRRKTSTKGTWWAYMPTYDLKVTAEFVKKK